METLNYSPINNINSTQHFMNNKKVVFLMLLLNILMIGGCGGASSNSPNTSSVPEIIEGTNLSQFSFLTSNNPNLANDIIMDISAGNITGRIETNTNIEELIASFTHDGNTVTVNNTNQISGTTSNNFLNKLVYTVKTSSGQQQVYEVDLTKFTGLPIIYLTTDGNAEIVSKEEYIEGDVLVDGGRNYSNLPSSSMKIRGRGNSTWFTHPKKPFQMKLSVESEFLDMPEHKKWLFLAEYSDKTMLRNTIAFEMGHLSSLDWTPESSFAEVYINDQYNGTYNITQKVEAGINRVDIGNTGYLMEIDQLDRLDFDDVYFRTNSFLINIKEPELLLGSPEYNYIDGLINEFESALYGAGFKDPTTGYAKYIDIDSFIDWYLISEITKNVDSKFFSSIYLNVIPGEKIKMGPLWDFDLSFGNVDYADSQYSDGYWVKFHPWYNRLFQDEAFVTKIKNRFAFYKNNQHYILDKIDQHAENLKWAQQENDNRWQTLGIYVWPNPVIFDSYDEEVSHLKNWYVTRMNWLEQAFNKL